MSHATQAHNDDVRLANSLRAGSTVQARQAAKTPLKVWHHGISKHVGFHRPTWAIYSQRALKTPYLKA